MADTRHEPPQLQVPLGTRDDPGSIHGLVVAGSALLVAHYPASGWGNLHSLDPATLAPVAQPVPVGQYPRAVAYHPGRRAAYVMNWGKESYSISECHLETGAVTEIPIGFGMIAVAVDPVADLIYVADWAHRRLIVLEAADPSQRRFIELPTRPARLAVTADGDVVVSLFLKGANPPDDALAIVHPDGSMQVASISPGHLQPTEVAIGHDGMVYLGSLGGGGVYPLAGVHDPETAQRLGSVHAGAGIRGLAAHPHLARAWAATDRGARMIDTTDPHRPQVLPEIVTGGSPYGVAVGPDGTVYVGDNADGTVSMIEPDFTELPLEVVSTLLTQAGYPVAAGLGQAIRKYQVFYGLPETGRPDLTTVGHLTAPGCGNPDVMAAPAGFTLTGSHYRHTNITYYLGDMHMPYGVPELTDEVKEEVIRVAFQDWSTILSDNWAPPFEFTRVYSPAEADLVFSVGDHEEFDKGGLFRTVFGLTDYEADKQDEPVWPGERAQLPIIFNKNVAWYAYGHHDWYEDGQSFPRDFRHVVVHELGHALGFDHTNKSKAVMYRNASWYRIPKHDDRAGMLAMYGRLPHSGTVGMEAFAGQSHISYQDSEQHLLVHSRDGEQWVHTRLTADIGAPKLARGGPPSLFFAQDGVPSYVYRGIDDRVHQLWHSDGAWHWGDLTAGSGDAPPAAQQPRAYRNGATQRVVYVTPDGRVIRLSQAPGQGWQWEDVSQPGAGTPLDSSPMGYVDEATGFDVIAYRDNEEGLRLLQEGPAGWSNISLNWATQHEHPMLLDAAPISGMARIGEQHRLFCTDHGPGIRMFFRGADGAWHTRSLTAELGLPPVHSMVLQRIGEPGKQEWVLIFSDYAGQLWELSSAGEAWSAQVIEPGENPPAGNYRLAAWLTGTERHISYTGVNGNVRLLSRPLTDQTGNWRLTNLTRSSGVV